jgi:hypothetical protein
MLSHVSMVPIVESTLPCALISPLDIFAPEKKAMNDKSTNLERQISLSSQNGAGVTYCSVRHKQRECERSSKLGQAKIGQGCFI